MLDRLISGAGAVTDGADRSVRLLAAGTRRGGATRPWSVAVAVILLVLAALFVVAGLEATDPGTPVELAAADLAHGRSQGGRTYATVSGSLSTAYVEYYFDDDGDGRQDEREETFEWFYWFVDPVARAGVTVRTARPPAEILTFHATGTLIKAAQYAELDTLLEGKEATEAGLTIKPDVVVDLTSTSTASGQAFDLSGPMPAAGTRVDLSGSRLSTWAAVCARDPDRDGICDEFEADRYEIVVYDPDSKQGVRVRVSELPEFGQPTVMTGRLHREERAIDDARTVDGTDFGDLDLDVSSVYVLDEGIGPRSAPLAFGVAAVLLVVAGIILIGLAGGYLIYRKGGTGLPMSATTLLPGERLPLRITGSVRTPDGLEHVRETPGELIRFVLGRPVEVVRGSVGEPPPIDALQPVEGPEPASEPTERPDAAPIPTTLLVERVGFPQGVALGLGELVRLSSGQVMALRGPRPAIRVVAGTGPLLLSFDDDASRDRAAAELLDESGLGPDGAHIRTP